METFEVNPKSLSYLLEAVHNGALALPDFQRDFVWRAPDYCFSREPELARGAGAPLPRFVESQSARVPQKRICRPPSKGTLSASIRAVPDRVPLARR